MIPRPRAARVEESRRRRVLAAACSLIPFVRGTQHGPRCLTAGSRRGTGHEGARRRACDRRDSAKGGGGGCRGTIATLFGRRACRQAESSCTLLPDAQASGAFRSNASRQQKESARRTRATRGENERALFRSSERRRRLRRCIDSHSLPSWRIQRPRGRLARAPIAIPGLLTGRHLSRAGGKERERGAEESDAGVHSENEFCEREEERRLPKKEKKNFVRRRRRSSHSFSLLQDSRSR